MQPEILSCSKEESDRYLPFVSTSDEVDDCVAYLCTVCADGDTEPEYIMSEIEDEQDVQQLGFTKLQYRYPNEKIGFKPMKFIGQAIKNFKYPGRTANFFYRECGDNGIKSDIDGSGHKVDACFTENPEGDHLTSSTAVSSEYKLKWSPENECDNNKKVVSASVQIMNDDARRTHAYGITMEGDDMRFWYFCRSHSIVSERVNFITDPKYLVKVFMAFIFAERHEMGYDPTVTRHEDGLYTYKVSDRFFRTVRTLSEYRTCNITGRMPRIWLVNEVDSNDRSASEVGPRRVLKDVWLEDTARTEKQIQNALFSDIEAFWMHTTLPDGKKELEPFRDAHAILVKSGLFKNHFLSIYEDCEGRKTVPSPTTPRVEIGLFDLEATRKKYGLEPNQHIGLRTEERSKNSTPRVIPQKTEKPPVARQYVRKKQYRVVFNEVCKTIGELGTLGEVVNVLGQTLIALQLMFCTGWVHRDLSSGNILAIESNNGWQVKLSDLEYSKPFPPTQGYKASADPKTGTPYFMAHEILDQRYIWNRSDVQFLRGKTNAELEEEYDKGLILNPATASVIHNFQHDLESVWWLLFWTLTARIKYQPSLRFAKTIFCNTISLPNARRDALRDPLREKLLNSLTDKAQGFVKVVDILRSRLLNEYSLRVNNQDLFKPGSYVFIHETFQRYFGTALPSDDLGWRDIQLPLSGFVDQLNLDSNSELGTEEGTKHNLSRTRPPPKPKRFRDDGPDDAYEPRKSKRSRGGEQHICPIFSVICE